MLLGCIADDFTGASDLANTLAKQGMRTTQYIDIPPPHTECDCDAAIISLKSRSIDSADAITQSLQALQWLKGKGAAQYLFKYCSTFDSTRNGNIGPVAEALADALGTGAVVDCPAFPTTGRTVYQGHLFVFDKLLNESGLENHPLNPMTDADLRRWLALQCKYRVGHVAHQTVARGSAAVRQALEKADSANEKLVIVDATADEDLRCVGKAVADAPLVTGGSGIALGLPQNFRERGELSDQSSGFSPQNGPAAILAGSCSATTRKQITHNNHGPRISLDVLKILNGSVTADTLLYEIAGNSEPLIYSSADPESVNELQLTHGTIQVAEAIESFFGNLAVALISRGFNRLVVAGGETSGAVISALQLSAFHIGPEIDPGVPALSTTGSSPIAVALKSGNFGGDNFFYNALTALGSADATTDE
ncbi:hypothetical protein AB833_10770 [Chromatiales bacterium (ex Bugula neritina AB1)]|nr:hypothetical protein AB833_10770 [Chromatiales bacterium (ex Bugula neritina AB1)]